MVGIASNYVKKDLGLTDTMANTLPSLVFLWFLIFSIPTSLLMNKIGRKNTVLVSLFMTLAAMVIPVFTLNFTMLLLSFSLLGIGNAIMQTSLNPLVDSVMKGGASAKTFTFGQFIKGFASCMAPYIASWGANTNAFGYGWRVLYPIYLGAGVLTTLLLFSNRINETPSTQKQEAVSQQFADCFALLKNPFILLCFLAIVFHVGIDVGTSITAPRILEELFGTGLNDAAFIVIVYFIAKAAGSFSGSFILNYMKDWTLFLISVLMMVVSVFGLLFCKDITVVYASVALMGLGNGNPFSIVFARALQAVPDKKNEVSGLLIMGICGGAIPVFMGFASDAIGQIGAVLVMTVGILYLLGFWLQGNSKKTSHA